MKIAPILNGKGGLATSLSPMNVFYQMHRKMKKEKTIVNAAKTAVAAGVGLFLSACAGAGPIDTVSESRLNDAWKGHPVTEALGKWGGPVVVRPDGNGTTLYQWMFGENYVYDQYTGSDTKYTGESAQYHSDGHITYSPEYETTDHYEKRRGSRICVLQLHADANGAIMNLETKDTDGGCKEFYSGTHSTPPDAAAIAKGKVYADRFQTLKSIAARYEATCTKPEYLALFGKSPCDPSGMKIVGARKESQMTPEQKAVLGKWSVEMNAIIEDYLAFFRGTGSHSDKATVDSVEQMRSIENSGKFNAFLVQEISTSTHARQLEQYTKDAYGKYLN